MIYTAYSRSAQMVFVVRNMHPEDPILGRAHCERFKYILGLVCACLIFTTYLDF